MSIISSAHHDIEVGLLADSSLASILEGYSVHRTIIVVDQNTHDLCLEYLITSFPQLEQAEVILLPVGEENKVMEICMQVWNAFSEYEFGRKDLVINLGGGLVSDMGGFIASVYKRGMDFINIPTSLLGMVDASIGGKNGIDLNECKNQIGTFTSPINVYVDLSFLATLPEEEFYNGFAEMIKYAIIKDKELFHILKEFKDEEDFNREDVIHRCIQIKVSIVDADIHEKGLRKILNFGHTFGHAIEGYFMRTTPIHHGQAVGIGICAEAFVSMNRELITKEEYKEIESVMRRVYPFIKFSDDDTKAIIKLMYNDKKNESGKIFSVLLNGLGEASYHNELSENEIGEALLHISMLSDTLN